MLQNGVSHRCACVKRSAKGGIAPFWGRANLLRRYRDMGYRNDSIALSRDKRPLGSGPFLLVHRPPQAFINISD